MFERYERGMSESQIRERLDGFAIFLEDNPAYRADIMAYGGRRSCRGEALKRAQLASEYLTNEKGIAAARIAISDGGYREKWAVELWKGVDGSARPFSMLTIDRNKVKIINNCRITRNNHHSLQSESNKGCQHTASYPEELHPAIVTVRIAAGTRPS